MKFLPQKVRISKDPKLEQLLNDMLAEMRANKPRSSPTVAVNQTANGTTLTALVKPGGGGTDIQRLTFKQSLGDYFLTDEGIAVAKPDKLRCSITSETIYGLVYTFTYPNNPAGGGPSSDPLAYLFRVSSTPTLSPDENQGVVPQYLPGDKIPCAVINGGTDVMSDPLDLETSAGGVAVPITWMQVGGAHAWSRFDD